MYSMKKAEMFRLKHDCGQEYKIGVNLRSKHVFFFDTRQSYIICKKCYKDISAHVLFIKHFGGEILI